MRKILTYAILILFISTNCFATTIDGGVKYDVNSAREYVFSDMPQFKLNADTPYYIKRGPNIGHLIYSYDNNNNILATTVQYKNELNRAYIYNKEKNLIYIDIYDKNTSQYPHRGYRYNMQGKLILTSLSISKNEHYRFDYMGNLISYTKNKIIYDENGKQIGTIKE